MTLSNLLATDTPDTENILQTLNKQALPDLIHSITEKKPGSEFRVTRLEDNVQSHTASQYLERAYDETHEEGVRCKILESLGKYRDRSQLAWLQRHLDDPHTNIQCFTIWALGELRDSRGSDSLRRKLWSPDRYVQMTAIDALGKLPKDPNAALEISTFLRDEDVQLRYLAAKALYNIAGPHAAPEIAQRLMDEPSVDVQEVLARTLGHTGEAVGVGRLIELLKNPSSQVTEHWSELGLKAGDPSVVIPAIAPLLQSKDFRLKVSAARIVSEIETLTSWDGSVHWKAYLDRWETGDDLIARAAATQLKERMNSAHEN